MSATGSPRQNPWQPGQLLMVGFDGLRLPPDLAQRIAEGRVGGVALFRRNVEDPKQLRTLIEELYSHAPEACPLLIALDQEGGRVARLREPWTRWPAMREVGLDDVEGVARGLATEVREAGFSLNFAPVVDVDSNPDNPVIGDRSFSSDPGKVGELAKRFVKAHQDAGLAACAKHFPGHGDTAQDSHMELPLLAHKLERLRKVELPPFADAIAAEVASIMSAHVLFPKLDAKRPATLSPAVMGLLRAELGYEGLILTDDLEMGAIAKHWGPRDRTVLPLEAGCDQLLVCHSADLREEMLNILESAPDALVEASLERTVAFKEKWAMREIPAIVSGPPYAEHQALATRLGREQGPAPGRRDPTNFR